MIYIYKELASKQNMPHFHAKYAEFEGVYDFKANLIEGELPPKQRKLVEAWTLLHEDELNAAWVAWNESGEVIKMVGPVVSHRYLLFLLAIISSDTSLYS